MISMCYDNRLTDSGKRIWSGLCLLADVTTKVKEEQQLRDEENMKKIFSLYPRKIRSCLMKRRRTQKYLYTASHPSSSSALPDLNLIPTDDSETEHPQNPSSDSEPMVCDYEVNEKRFVTRRYRQKQSFDHHLNGASTSSSFHCSDHQTEKKESPNPNYHSSSSSPSSSLTDNVSRKRRGLKQRKRTGGFKKAKFVSFPRMVTETPEWVFKVMSDKNADAEPPRLIFERKLSASDVNSGQSRLLIPFKKLIRNDFLTTAECRVMKNEEEDDENIGVGTILVNHRYDQNNQMRYDMWGLRFKIWAMEKKESGNGTLNYNLNWGWNDVVKGNVLKEDDKISLWIFRCRGILFFALDTQ